MANEKVTQLIELAATEIAPTDLFFIADVSTHESKKLQASSLLTYVNISASINANHAINADTSSYIVGSNVSGPVNSSSFSAVSISSSHALVANTAITASFALSTPSTLSIPTASFLLYSGVSNGTSSFALTASLVYNTQTASFLQYNGNTNGTSSYSISSSTTITSSYSLLAGSVSSASFATSASYSSASTISDTASFVAPFTLYSSGPVKAWAFVSWSLGISLPKIISQYNIATIQYISPSLVLNVTTSLFGISFSTPLQNTDYCLIGQGSTWMDPITNRTTSSFTMSIGTTVANSVFYGIPATSRNINNAVGFTAFQILGL